MTESNGGGIGKETMVMICRSLYDFDGKARGKDIEEDIDSIVKEGQIGNAMNELDFVESKQIGIYRYWVCDPENIVDYVNNSDHLQNLTTHEEWLQQKRDYVTKYENDE